MKNKMKPKNVIYAQMLIVVIYAHFVMKIFVLIVQISVEIIHVKILYVLSALYFVIYAKI
jgi:hypothetical protein